MKSKSALAGMHRYIYFSVECYNKKPNPFVPMLKNLDGKKVLLWGVVSWVVLIVLLTLFGG